MSKLLRFGGAVSLIIGLAVEVGGIRTKRYPSPWGSPPGCRGALSRSAGVIIAQ